VGGKITRVVVLVKMMANKEQAISKSDGHRSKASDCLVKMKMGSRENII
jgi:hypothetical protein